MVSNKPIATTVAEFYAAYKVYKAAMAWVKEGFVSLNRPIKKARSIWPKVKMPATKGFLLR